MGVLDKFLNAMKLNDDDDMDDDEFLDDEVDEMEEERPKKHLFKSRDEDDDEESDNEPKRRTKSSQVKAVPKQKTTRQTQTTSVASSSTSSKVSPIRPRKKSSSSALSGEIYVLKPRSLNEAYQITEALWNNCTVILNLEEAPAEEAQRIVDFSSGTCYALSGRIEQISPSNNKMLVITPETVELSGDFQTRVGTTLDVHSRF